tara:strand:- start:53 stop:307 length:255 start_codon:yes stop_codon:yes gene_type:complete
MNIPNNIKSLLNRNNIIDATGMSGQNQSLEEIIYENKLFILIKDKKHKEESYHYTAFIKEDIRSLIEINLDITNSILDIKSNLL